MKIIIIAVVLVLVLGGGGYYYWEIYRVPQAAIDLVLLFQKDFGGAMQKVQSAQPKDTDDYAVILSAIEATREDFKNVEDKLAAMWPPSKLRETKSAMLEMVKATRSVLAGAETQARFMSDLSDMIRTLIPKEVDKKLGPNATVGDLTGLWTDAIPKMKSKGDALFAKEPVALQEVTFEDLRAKWNEGRDHFDVVLVLARAQNQRAPVSSFNLGQVRMMERERASFNKAGAFLDLAQRAISQNSAYDLRSGGWAGQSVQEELQAKNAALETAFRKFSDQYPDIVKKIEAEAQKRGLKP